MSTPDADQPSVLSSLSLREAVRPAIVAFTILRAGAGLRQGSSGLGEVGDPPAGHPELLTGTSALCACRARRPGETMPTVFRARLLGCRAGLLDAYRRGGAMMWARVVG